MRRQATEEVLRLSAEVLWLAAIGTYSLNLQLQQRQLLEKAGAGWAAVIGVGCLLSVVRAVNLAVLKARLLPWRPSASTSSNPWADSVFPPICLSNLARSLQRALNAVVKLWWGQAYHHTNAAAPLNGRWKPSLYALFASWSGTVLTFRILESWFSNILYFRITRDGSEWWIQIPVAYLHKFWFSKSVIGFRNLNC